MDADVANNNGLVCLFWGSSISFHKKKVLVFTT